MKIRSGIENMKNLIEVDVAGNPPSAGARCKLVFAKVMQHCQPTQSACSYFQQITPSKYTESLFYQSFIHDIIKLCQRKLWLGHNNRLTLSFKFAPLYEVKVHEHPICQWHG